ncbi:GNAT family N-acetyltransferase [Rufibacter sediminis]|uniref:N-acetyltransferase n=1 Tax=Rufibacter sediminis TaxID=2762756 RepID=A0ABR6VSP6_9BACT|nr:GNAT family N-acetyltransferase [Rufibacter sediminis]MBC3539616.1 N-acetyltransferase [Rufibacter sediminis]
MELDIKNNPAAHRFETTVDGSTAVVEYRLKGNVITVLHTKVPKELEGQGIAAALTKQVLTYIADEKLELVPLCPYMAAYLQKHPEYQTLVKK